MIKLDLMVKKLYYNCSYYIFKYYVYVLVGLVFYQVVVEFKIHCREKILVFLYIFVYFLYCIYVRRVYIIIVFFLI